MDAKDILALISRDNLVVGKNKICFDAGPCKDRVAAKKWKERWPKLKILDL